MMDADGLNIDPLIGKEIFGTYKLEEVLGRGGMAVVYKGRHVLTDQTVAVKVLPPELAEQPQVKARFIDEARTLARLEHPNIVALHNFLEDAGHLYLIMQFAEGDTFDELIDREGRVTAADVVAVGVETLKALEYAHGQGVIHRDIKPSNIIIRDDSSVKVMDFGIAKIMGSTKLTVTGQTMGTVRFMSPEQVRGKDVDHRSDLYSLGVSLYQAVAGQTPFDGETHFEIMRKHLSELPPPPSGLVELPEGLEDVLLHSLKKRADARFQSAEAFRKALESVPVDIASRKLTRSLSAVAAIDSENAGVSTPTPWRGEPSSSGSRWPLLAAAVLLLLAMAGVVWVFMSGESDRPRGALGRGNPPRSAAIDGRVGRAPLRWPPLHRVAKGLKVASDRRFPRARLRVLSQHPQRVERLVAFYEKAKSTYVTYLRQEGLRLDIRIGPLNLVLLPQSVLNSKKYWSGVKPNVDYPTRYYPSAGTLYVQDGKNTRESDLAYGLGLHFCVRVEQLSNARCKQLADGFEHFMRKSPR